MFSCCMPIFQGSGFQKHRGEGLFTCCRHWLDLHPRRLRTFARRCRKVIPSDLGQGGPPLRAIPGQPHSPSFRERGVRGGGEFLPWAAGGCRAVDTLVMPSCSHRCQGGQGGKRIPEVPLTRARVNPRPSSCVTFLSMVELRASWGVVCLQKSPLGLRTSKGSQTDL